MKLTKLLTITLTLSLLLSACGTAETGEGKSSASLDAVEIRLHDSEITVDGAAAGTAAENAVYVGSDIVYYEDGKDFTYGEGTVQDAHSAETAAAHTVVHIAQPGTYRIQGSLSRGQIAVDLGEDAKNDPNAVVTLILNGVDISCEVAPAIIFYRVYECNSVDTATKDVDTSSAGANVIIADGSENTVNGAYVARIYKPGSVVLDESGTEVADAEKLHKYDGAFYSRMSMNINGGAESNGILTINAVNEGLGSELHLTVNGGIIRINSGNDGINTNEDGKSVTTINGGELHITVTGETGEGDGIDSNGWLVINGGAVTASACGFSADAGIDSDMGIYINGGTLMAAGQMLDRIAGGDATYAVFRIDGTLPGGTVLTLKNEAGETAMESAPVNDFSVLILSGEALVPGTYSFWMGDTQLLGVSGGVSGGPDFFGGMEGSVGTPGDVPGRFEGEPPEGDYEIPPQPQPGGSMTTQGIRPGAGSVQDGTETQTDPTGPFGPGGLAGMNPPDLPAEPIESRPPEGDYELPPQPGGQWQTQDAPEGFRPQSDEAVTEFVIHQGGNLFTVVIPATE